MKQILKTMLFGAMATTLWSCSNDNLPGTDTNTPTFYGDGYLAVDIQLPTQTGDTRANDDFNDGVESEYAVKNGVILLFTGNSETEATFQGAYDLMKFDTTQPDVDNDQITTTYKKVLKVNNFTVVGKIYGLVMLNYQNVGKIATNQGFQIGENTLAKGTTKYADVLTYTKNVTTAAVNSNPFIVDNGSYFFMTNTVLCDQPGGGKAPTNGKLTTLADLGTQLYESETEASDRVSGSIFVERGVAKVTMSMNNNLSISITEGDVNNGATSLSVKSAEFALGNLEYDSYVVRHMSTSYLEYGTELTSLSNTNKKYRFAGSTKIGSTVLQENVDYYRTYWCEDPHYATSNHEYHADLTGYANCNGISPLYCFENSFTVKDQTWRNTTRAVVKVVLNHGNDFYTINRDDDIYYSEENAKSHVVAYLSQSQLLQDEIKKVIGESTEIKYADYFTVNYAEKLTRKGILKVIGVTPSDALKTRDASKTTFDCEKTVKEDVNKAVKLYKYVGGACYYSIMIKHFGDDHTPWAHTGDNNYSSTTVEEAYSATTNETKASQNYLGRYGLVRNNWYDLNITKLIKLGSPVVPSIGKIEDPSNPGPDDPYEHGDPDDPDDPHDPDTPDDNNIVDRYIAFKVNVLSWAKRTHGYELK